MSEHGYDGYDYLKVTVEEGLVSQYMDGYENFGWKPDANIGLEKNMGKATLHLKRGRYIVNKVELTRLQRHYEACMEEIAALESSRQSVPSMVSLCLGLTGRGFMAGSVFAVTAEPPVVWMTVVFGALGFFFWFFSWFGYKMVKRTRTKKVLPLIDAKYEETVQVCEKARRLLPRVIDSKEGT